MLKCLTVKQPWASLIMGDAKDIENRDWPTTIRGVIGIHSSKLLEQVEMKAACDLMRGFIPMFSELTFRKRSVFPLGSILGTVELVDCVTSSNSPWFVGEYGLVLRNPVVFQKPIPCRGQLGLWMVPNHLLPAVREQWKLAKAA